MMAIRYHADVNYINPQGQMDMAQTFNYASMAEAEAEANGIIRSLTEHGCKDIKMYIRKVWCVVDEEGKVIKEAL